MNRVRRSLAVGVSAVLLLGALAACGGGSDAADSPTLTVYDGQHGVTSKPLIQAFEKKTGITVTNRSGESAALAHQIITEGSKSPADVFYSEEAAPMLLLAEKGRLATLNQDVLAPIPKQYRGLDDDWTGVTARARVVVYDPTKISPDQMPASVLDFADPTWKGKIGIVPTSGSFQEQISAVIRMDGKQAALKWLSGLKKNAELYSGNTEALDGVNQGQVEVALINHYYWFREVAEKGADKVPSKLFYFENGGPGSLVNVSPMGVVDSTDNKQAAEKFVKFATSKEGQQVLAKASAEYPLNPAVSSPFDLVPFDKLNAPHLSIEKLGDGQEAVALLQQVGLL